MARLTDWGCWEIGANRQSRGLSYHHYFFSVSRREEISVPIETFMDVCPLYWSLPISCQCHKRIRVFLFFKSSRDVFRGESCHLFPYYGDDNSFIQVNKQQQLCPYNVIGCLLLYRRRCYLIHIQWEKRSGVKSLDIWNCRFMTASLINRFERPGHEATSRTTSFFVKKRKEKILDGLFIHLVNQTRARGRSSSRSPVVVTVSRINIQPSY